jgi:hypothetical protein
MRKFEVMFLRTSSVSLELIPGINVGYSHGDIYLDISWLQWSLDFSWTLVREDENYGRESCDICGKESSNILIEATFVAKCPSCAKEE